MQIKLLYMIESFTTFQYEGFKIASISIQVCHRQVFESIPLILFREIFQCSVLLSFWRVRHAWHKNILKKCAEIEKQAEILRQLGQAVDRVCQGDENVDSFEQLIKHQIDDPDFIDYFKATWCPRLGLYPSVL